MKRADIDRNRKKAARRKKVAIQFSLALIIVLLVFGYFEIEQNPIELMTHDYTCNHQECSYQIKVRNNDHFSHPGYLRRYGFIKISRGDTTSREVVVSERVEYDIQAGEEKVLNGKFTVVTKPHIVNFSVGKVSESI